MDNFISNILPSKKTFFGKDSDIDLKIELKADEKQIFNDKVQYVLSSAQQFNLERQNSSSYKISGQIECLSPLTGIKKTSSKTSDLFDYLSSEDNIENFYTIKDFFDVYILFPETYYGDKGNLSLKLTPLTTVNDSDLFNSAFYTNMFYEQIYQYIFNNDIELSGKTTTIESIKQYYPITELCLFLRFKNTESKFEHTFENFTSVNDLTLINKTGNISDIELNNGLFGGIYSFNEETYRLDYLENVLYNIKFKLSDKTLSFNYNPFIKIKIRDLSDNIETGDILTTENIPYYSSLLLDLTNNFVNTATENYYIDNTNFYSGTTRLDMNDPLMMLPRKLIFNTNSNFFEYYLDNNVYDTSFFEIYRNNVLLIEGLDYILSDFEKNKIIFRFKPLLTNNFVFNYIKGLNYLWRDLLDIGYIEPNSGLGVDYPFINNKHYLFNYNKLFIVPDMNDLDTNDFFCKFNFQTSNNHVNNNTDFTGDNC